MAEVGSVVGDVFSGLFSGTVSVLLWVFGALLLIVIVGGVLYYGFVYRKKFDIFVKIVSRRTGDNRILFDNAAIFNDKKNNTRYLRLWKLKVDLELPKFDIMHHTNKGDYIEIYRDSELGFSFLTPPQISKKEMVSADGKIYPVTRSKQYKIEQDIDWVLNRQKKNKQILNPESFLMKLLEFTPQIISMVVSLMVIWAIFKYAPDLLRQLNELAKTLNGDSPPQEVAIIGSLFPLLWSSKWKKNL